ncbi:MFS transporter [Capnocytophaga sp. H4358]|nr:MFS transporter [Capnocytophaga sp. H4358]
MEKARSNFFDTQVLGHPAGLFVLFFTEMWERFSFYGMRVLLINFLTMAMIGYNPGWQWTTENAGALFGTYVMLLYLTPIVGGIIADRFTGYRWAIVIGAVIMTLGHAAMAVETEFWLYVGLGLLVVGTGFFKPNMTSIISHMYKDLPEKKDGAYTIFYMGVNAGAFFGMMLCGYIAEKVGWSWGFGLAGVFMLLGTLQFWLARPLFGTVGDVPSKARKEVSEKQHVNKEINDLEKRNPFTMLDKVLIAIAAIIGLGYAINDPLSRIGGIDLFKFLETQNIKGQYIAVVFGLFVFLFVVISRISRYTKIVRNRMITVIIFAFFTVFFWLSFEQGASSLIIFARDNVQRELLGSQAVIFNVVNALLTVIPLLLITYVLYLLGKKTFSKIFASNIVLLVCFGLVWVVVGWMLKRDFNTVAYSVSYDAFQVYDSDGKDLKINAEGDFILKHVPLAIDDTKLASEVHITTKTQKIFKITEVDVSGKTIKKYNHPKGNMKL